MISLFLGIASSCCFLSGRNGVAISSGELSDDGSFRYTMGSTPGAVVSGQKYDDYSDLKVEHCGPHYNFYKFAADSSAIYLKKGKVYSFQSKDKLVLLHTPEEEFKPISFAGEVSEKEFIQTINRQFPSVIHPCFYIHIDKKEGDSLIKNIAYSFRALAIILIASYAIGFTYKQVEGLVSAGSGWVDIVYLPFMLIVVMLAIKFLYNRY